MNFTLPPPPLVYTGFTPEPALSFYGIVVGGTGKGVLVSQTSKISSVLTDEMFEYLQDRANQLGISFHDVYDEEMAAIAELEKSTPSTAWFLGFARTGGPPPGLPDDP